MRDADTELGPVDYVVVAFPAGKANFSGEMASELRTLMDSNTVRVLDLVLVTKDTDGSVEASELRDADDSEVGQLRAAEADLAVLLAESDVAEIGGVLEPGSTAAVLVWENTWAAPFAPPERKGCDMPLLRDRSDRPGLLGRGRDRRDDRQDDRGDRRDDRQDDRGDRRDDRQDDRGGRRDDRQDDRGDRRDDRQHRRRRGPGLFR
jgi:hypothetical protein